MTKKVDPQARARCESRARVFKAISHVSRVIMLEELAKGGPKCVCELAEVAELDMSTTSRHLSLMKQAGILADEKRGQMTFYRLRTPCVMKFLECVDDVIEEGLRTQLGLLR
ncbi:MAG: ArsR/SmtB family transcription factor [Thermogutta sp.]